MKHIPPTVHAFLLAIALVAFPSSATLAKNPAGDSTPLYPDSTPGAGPVRSEDWFVNVWHERRDLFAKEKSDQQHAIVFLGDSITQGWSEDFRGRFKNTNLKLANRGLSGDITRGILARLDDDVLALDPQAIILLIGTNDLDVGLTPEQIAANVKLILDRLTAHNANMPIILCKVMPSSAIMKRPADKIKEINDRVADIARDFKQVTILDTYTLFANAEGDAKKEEFPDLLHPNDIGYDKWHNALIPLFATLGILETEPDAFQPEPGFELLFNGHDLTGWGYRKTSDEERANIEKWRAADKKMPPYPVVDTPVTFDGESASADGRFRAIAGRLVATTPPGGRCVQQINTTRDFPEDFTLRLDFRATPNADSGVFIRGRQLQCRDYALAGPYKDLKKYKPQDWNELEIVVKGNEARCTCNGEPLEAAYKIPATGPIGLEGDRGQMEYRHIRLRRDDGASNHESQNDQAALQGEWFPTAAQLAGKPMPDDFLKSIRLKLNKNKYEAQVAGKPDKGTWTIDPESNPKSMTINDATGPHAGETLLAIYELDGDTLRVCYDLSGKACPKEFKSTEGTKLFLVTYKRKK